MEATKVNTAFLSNFEVMEVLKELKLKDSKRKFMMRNFATITYETLKFLEDSPCVLQSKENISDFLKAVEPFNLVKIEKLLMINEPPTTPLQIQLIVEDSEERLSEEDVDKLLDVIANTLPVPEINDEEND
ncbi:DNA-directed RNA polymerase III subunit RPC9-like [Ctenocephalides felis]|uniref:DNA-directed RNA polymerase III subunit RPC9-like n=1 Tax=Ctenocephalides felis TaxID=7515 RepID=UPI000E6E4E07|nr:DNA-directed RNA polymerase III subunit RPC9-like [Ctenocephalides felis]